MRSILFTIFLMASCVLFGQDNYLPEDLSKRLPSHARSNYQAFFDSSKYVLFLDNNRIMVSANIQKGVCEEKYDEEKQTGTFVPSFIDSGYYYSYSVIDIQEELGGSMSLLQSNVVRYNRSSRSQNKVYSTITGDSSENRMIQHELVRRPETRIRYDRNDPSRAMVYRCGPNFGIVRNSNGYSSFSTISSRETPSIFGMNGSFFCFNESANEFIELDLNGEIVNREKVSIKKPLIYSKKDQRIVLDEVAKELYVLVLTNFGYNWYSLDEYTGTATLELQIDGMWLNPDWKVENGVLSYQRMENGVMTRKSEDL